MANLPQHWSPLRDLDHFRREFDEIFDRFLGFRPAAEPGHGAAAPSIESYTDNGNLIVRADLPGIDPKDVEVSVTGNTLVVRGKRETTREQKDSNYIHREVSYGSFERTIALPEGVNSDQIKASYKNGVLELTVPIPKESAPRKVPIEIESGKS